MRNLILIVFIFLSFTVSFIFGYIYNYIEIKHSKNNTYITEKENVKSEKEENEINENVYANPIDAAQSICIENSISLEDKTECINTSRNAWEFDMNKYFVLLKNVTYADNYALIAKSQSNWEKLNAKDKEIIMKFIYKHKETKYYKIAADLINNTVKERANFLNEIYTVYTGSFSI